MIPLCRSMLRLFFWSGPADALVLGKPESIPKAQQRQFLSACIQCRTIVNTCLSRSCQEEVRSLSSLESIALNTATDSHSLLGCVWLLCSAPIQSPTAIAGISRATADHPQDYKQGRDRALEGRAKLPRRVKAGRDRWTMGLY